MKKVARVLEPVPFADNIQFSEEGRESIYNSCVGLIRRKINKGEKLTKEERYIITEEVNRSTYFRTAVAVRGWRVPFEDVLNKYLFKTKDGFWFEVYACDKTSLRKYFSYQGVSKIVELNE